MNRFLVHLPLLFIVCAGAGLLVHGPIPQLPHYHEFADQSAVFGVPHTADVVSNIGFAIVGLWGLLGLWRARGNPARAAGRPGYALFLSALVLTSAGSAFYHLAPDNARLVWDRLPIALACAGLLGAVRAESRSGVDGRLGTALLAIAAVLSVLWWRITDGAGQGDLRPNLLLQASPLLLIPLWHAIYGAPRDERIAFGAAILLYVAAEGRGTERSRAVRRPQANQRTYGQTSAGYSCRGGVSPPRRTTVSSHGNPTITTSIKLVECSV